MKKQTKLSKEKKDKRENKFWINVSLDEIKASHEMMKKKIGEKKQKVLKKWVDLHRNKLKELDFKGKLPKRIKIK